MNRTYIYILERSRRRKGLSVMSGKRSFKKDLVTVMISNCVVLLGNVVTGFIVPKMLGVTEYGYYKIFTLYLGYVSLLHFGFVNGILIEYAGKEYDEIDKERMRAKTVFFMRLEIFISLLAAILAAILIGPLYRYIMILLGLDIFAVNLTAYFQNVSQSTSRFKELSFRKVLLAISKLALAALLYFAIKIDLIPRATADYYVTGLVIIDFILTIWYIITYKEIVFGTRVAFSSEKESIIQCFKTGIILMVCFQVNHLIFNLDRQFVSVLFDTNTYSVYSFAYHLISMITTIINAVALVLFPTLKKKKVDDIVESYTDSVGLVSIVALGALIGFYPFKVLIQVILPEYIGSIDYLRVILPGLVLSCCINIIMFTYYKALDKHVRFCIISCLVLAFAAVSNYLAYTLFKTPMAISVASILTLTVWYFASDYFFSKHYGTKWKKNAIYIICLMGTFYILSQLIHNDLLFVIIYAVAYMLMTFVMHKKLIVHYIKR